MDAGARACTDGDPIAIATYLGKSDAFDRSIADFSTRYADQNEKDYQAFLDAAKSRKSQWSRACSRPRIVGSLRSPGSSPSRQ